MATTLELRASERSETGRHVGAVRRRGDVPAVLYGHNLTPQNLALEERSLSRVWRRAGHSHLVDLTLGEGRPRKVLIRELQVDPRSARMLHVDLFAVNLLEKLTVDIPLVPVGEAPAVTVHQIGVLQQVMTTVKIECMPADIPAQLSVDISALDEIDAGVRLGDVPLPDGVALAPGIDPDELVLKIAALRVAEVEAVEEAVSSEPADEGAEAETAEA